MKILVTGAGGGLGQELARAWANDDLVLLDRTQLDVTDARHVSEVIPRARPELVVHAAAYTKVDQAEAEPDRARAVNVGGSENVATAAARAGATLVYISTDYVFDGSKGAPYVETDPPNPLSVYGRTKLEGEAAALSANPRTFVVRTSWLYSHFGKSFVTTMLRLFAERAALQRAGQPPPESLKVVADEVSAPTYAGDLAAALRQLIETDSYGLYHAASGGETSWHGFAAEIAAQSGSPVTIEPTTAKAYGLPAGRPAYSKLNTGKLAALGIVLPDWQDGLRHFFAAQTSPPIPKKDETTP